MRAIRKLAHYAAVGMAMAGRAAELSGVSRIGTHGEMRARIQVAGETLESRDSRPRRARQTEFCCAMRAGIARISVSGLLDRSPVVANNRVALD